MWIEFCFWLSSGFSRSVLPPFFGAASSWDRYPVLCVLFRIHPCLQIQSTHIQQQDLLKSPHNFPSPGFLGLFSFFFLFQKQDAQCWNSLTFHVGPLWDVTQGYCDFFVIFSIALTVWDSPQPQACTRPTHSWKTAHSRRAAVIRSSGAVLHGENKALHSLSWLCSPLPFPLEQKTLKLHLQSHCNIPSISRANSTTQPSTQGTSNSAKKFCQAINCLREKNPKKTPCQMSALGWSSLESFSQSVMSISKNEGKAQCFAQFWKGIILWNCNNREKPPSIE